VTFVSKPGKADYPEPKPYHPISLSSFLLKMMGKLVVKHIRDNVLRDSHLHQDQFAYQLGKSMETTLYGVGMQIENVIEHKEMALGDYLDIEGEFDRTLLEQ
jgi:hypothetical protein